MKSEQQIVDDCNELARTFYRMFGYSVPANYRFYETANPRAAQYWKLALEAYEHIEGTDVINALANREGTPT